jgi:hypothetical protein
MPGLRCGQKNRQIGGPDVHSIISLVFAFLDSPDEGHAYTHEAADLLYREPGILQ